MFEQTFVDGFGRTNKTWILLASFGVQTTGIITAVIVALLFTDALPRAQWTHIYMEPPVAHKPATPGISARTRVVKMIPRPFEAGQLIQPRSIPNNIAFTKEEDVPSAFDAQCVNCVPGGMPDGVPGGLPNGIMESIPAKMPPPPIVKMTDKKLPVMPRIRVGGNVQAANVIRASKPVYPSLARQARIQGVVRLNAVIGKDGTIQDLKAASGHPLLIPAALDAVRQWLYKPTLLNDEPAEVLTVIEVIFTLSQ